MELEVEYVKQFIDMQKLIINVLKVMIKIKNYHNYWDVNNLYDWTMPEKISVKNIEWIRDISQFH